MEYGYNKFTTAMALLVSTLRLAYLPAKYKYAPVQAHM